MYKLFLPKDYTFLGLVFGLPTALYASARNGLALKDAHPEVLRQTKTFVWAFLVLFLLSVVADGFALHATVGRFREVYAHYPSVYSSGWLNDNSLDQAARVTRDSFSYISWAFILAQLVVLILFVKKSKKIELPVYESLKQSQQVTARSNVELVAFGFGMWVLFWGYGQLVAQAMLAMTK